MLSFKTLVATFCIELLVQSVNADLPDPRWGHGAVLLKNNLYIYGGKVGNTTQGLNSTSQNSNQLLILDVSNSFPVSNPGWILRSVGPKVAYHTLSIGGPQNELLVLYGGEYPNTTAEPTPDNPLFYYNTSSDSSTWKNANLILGERREEHTAVTRLNDSMNYFFGGIPDIPSDTLSSQFQYNDLFKLDTINNLWNNQIEQNSPQGRFHHTSTILRDGKMYVIGGYSGNSLVPMSQIYVYDTINSVWSTSNAVGTLPTPRRAHVAVGTHDGKVIIHGGVDTVYTTMYGDVAVLDTTQSPYTWSIMETKGNVPLARYSHTATMVGTNMLIAFGFLQSYASDNNIYALDTITSTWVENYTPNHLDYTDTTPKTTTTPSAGTTPSTGTTSSAGPQKPQPSTQSSKAGIIAGSTIGAISFVLLLIGLFLFYRKRRRDRFYATPYPGAEEVSNQDNVKKHSVSSASTAVEDLPRTSMGNGLSVPIVETPEKGAHGKDFTTLLEERMMDSDIQQANFMVVPKSPLRVTNPDNDYND